ncbi:MAG: hypothetical protein AB7P52_04915 [Alphaproteobacteria bacterium]
MRRLTLGLCAALAVAAMASAGHAEDAAASLDPSAMDAAWRAAPLVSVSGEAGFKVPAKAGTEPVWHKLPFALRDGGVIELCALRGTLEARAQLDDLWVALGPIGQSEAAGPCILLSGQKVMVANPAGEAVTGRAQPR